MMACESSKIATKTTFRRTSLTGGPIHMATPEPVTPQQKRARLVTPLLFSPRHNTSLVASCPGDQEWSCHCSAGRQVHPNKSISSQIMRQWAVSELPLGRSLPSPSFLPPGVQLFKVTIPEGSPSGAPAISYFDLPVPCPKEVSITAAAPDSLSFALNFTPITQFENSSSDKILPWCTLWVPVAASTSSTPPRSCLCIADIDGSEYARMTIHSLVDGTTYKYTGTCALGSGMPSDHSIDHF